MNIQGELERERKRGREGERKKGKESGMERVEGERKRERERKRGNKGANKRETQCSVRGWEAKERGMGRECEREREGEKHKPLFHQHHFKVSVAASSQPETF